MTQEQSRDGESETIPTENRDENKPNNIIERDAKAARSVFATIALAVGVLATALYRKNGTAGGFMGSAAAIFGVIAGYFEFCAAHKRFFFGSRTVTVASTIGACLIAMSTWLWLSPKPIPAPPKQFNVIAGQGMLSLRLSPALTTGALGHLALGTSIPGKLILKPIDWMVYVTLTNNQGISTRVDGYFGFVAQNDNPNGKWLPLCRVPLDEGQIYFLNKQLTDVGILGTSKAIDRRLMEHTIAPFDGVSGWMAFECPGGQCGNLTKLSIHEANSRVSDTDPFPLSSTKSFLHDSWPETIAVHQNLANIPIEVRSSCEAPGTTGLMGLFPEVPATQQSEISKPQ